MKDTPKSATSATAIDRAADEARIGALVKKAVR